MEDDMIVGIKELKVKLEELREELNQKIQERDAFIDEGFKSDLEIVECDEGHYPIDVIKIDSMWNISCSNPHELCLGFVSQKSKILKLAAELKLMSMVDDQMAKDFDTIIDTANDKYYADLVKAFKILNMNYEIKEVELDIKSSTAKMRELMLKSGWESGI